MKRSNQKDHISLHICRKITVTRCLHQPTNLSNSSNSSFYDGVFSPHPNVAIPGHGADFFSETRIFKEDSMEGTKRQNLIHGALVFWLDPKLASPPSEDPKVGVHVASLHRFHINYESPKESKCFFVQNADWILFDSVSLAFSIVVFVFWLYLCLLCFFFVCFFPFNEQDLCSTSGWCDCRLPKYTMMCHHVWM